MESLFDKYMRLHQETGKSDYFDLAHDLLASQIAQEYQNELVLQKRQFQTPDFSGGAS